MMTTHKLASTIRINGRKCDRYEWGGTSGYRMTYLFWSVFPDNSVVATHSYLNEEEISRTLFAENFGLKALLDELELDDDWENWTDDQKVLLKLRIP